MNKQSQRGVLADSILSRATIAKLYRFALLLTGSPSVAEQLFLRIYEQSALQLGQFRTETHRTAFLVAKIREQSAQNVPGDAEEGNASGIATRFSALAEPWKSALALFYLDLFPVGELAALLNIEVENLGALLSTSREQLGQNQTPSGGESPKLKKGALLLPCYHPDKINQGDGRIAKAIKLAGNEPVLKARFEAQVAFDSECLHQIQDLQMPASLMERIDAAEQPDPKRVGLSVFKQPAFLSVGFAILVVIGVLFYFTLNRINRFAGQDNVLELLDTTQAMSGVELEPKTTQLGILGDYLFSKYGFENYKIPREFSAFKTEGCRVFKQNGKQVAQIAVEPDNLIFFVFQPGDFGVKLRAREGWRTFEQDGWAGAVRVYEGICVMIAMQGDKEDIEAILKKTMPKDKGGKAEVLDSALCTPTSHFSIGHSALPTLPIAGNECNRGLS